MTNTKQFKNKNFFKRNVDSLSNRIQLHWFPNYNFETVNQISNQKLITTKKRFGNFLQNFFFSLLLPIFFILTFPYAIVTRIKSFSKTLSIKLKHKAKHKKTRVKVLTIGNILLGGVGKTPAVIAIAKKLNSMGFTVAIISRGYAGHKHRINKDPELIHDDEETQALAKYFGDEPTLIHKATSLPVCVCINRSLAVHKLVKTYPKLDFIISDDGLQTNHQISQKKILIIDDRLLGNGYCLPFGPLRERWPTDYQIDLAVLNLSCLEQVNRAALAKIVEAKNIGAFYNARLTTPFWKTLAGNRMIEFNEIKKIANQEKDILFSTKRVLAFAGIGVPSKFFKCVQSLNIKFDELPLTNHATDLEEILDSIDLTVYKLLLTTEKDAIKLSRKNGKFKDKVWVLMTELCLPENFYDALVKD
jgi:tetraacyldisaccharide 4'-kinase